MYLFDMQCNMFPVSAAAKSVAAYTTAAAAAAAAADASLVFAATLQQCSIAVYSSITLLRVLTFRLLTSPKGHPLQPMKAQRAALSAQLTSRSNFEGYKCRVAGPGPLYWGSAGSLNAVTGYQCSTSLFL